MIGTKISRYVITEKIGEGGMGSVWRAEDPLLGRDIALKFLPESLASSPEARLRFLREGKAAATLRHPGIATVYDADESDGRIYIAFELVEGETVSERISRGPLAVSDACRVAFDAAEALDHAHESGVLHRDVTSRNIMIDKKGQVIVVDFGLALPHGATRVTQSGMAVGTAAYMAPEVIRGGDGDARADVYGLGVVLYEALTGSLPFDADRTESLSYLIVHTDPDPPSARREGIPAELDRIVMKALTKDPDERYASAREFAKDLHAVLETVSEQPPSARWLTAPPPRRDGKFKRLVRKPISWAVVAVVVAVVVWRLVTPPIPEPAFASVAVLPFRNLSETPGENDWLAEGLGETLTAKLTSVPGIRVSPWFTSRNFDDMSRPLAEIAKDLNVEALVMGTVRQFGNEVKCTITVVDSKTESQWWADEYKEPMDDLFSVQERIALGVATSLKGKLSGVEEKQLVRPTAHSVEAYEHYLRGSAGMQSGTQEAVIGALPFFERAIELDPEFAEAYVGLGAVYQDQYFNGWGGWQALQQSEDAFRHALELDPRLTQARRGLLRVYWQQGRSEDALKEGQAALRMNPDAIENMLAMGEAYVLGGLYEKAIPVLERVIALDPANDAAYYFLTWANLDSGNYNATIDVGEDYFRKFGDTVNVLFWVAAAYHALGDVDAAEVYYTRAIDLSSTQSTGYWFVIVQAVGLFQDMGDQEAALSLLSDQIDSLERKLAMHPDNYWMRNYLATMYGMKGNVERMRRELDKTRHGTPLGFHQAAALARLGDVPAAVALLEAHIREGCNLLNLTKYQPVFPDGFFERPDVEPARRAMKKLHDDLASRY